MSLQYRQHIGRPKEINIHMFNNSKYTKIYFSIVDRAKSRATAPPIERHHIVPKSLGGTNEKDNLVNLTPKEHRLCHLLLTKMVFDPKHKISMYCAAWRMYTASNHRGLSKGNWYQRMREKCAESQKGKIVSETTRQKIKEARSKQTNISNQFIAGTSTHNPRKGRNKHNDIGSAKTSAKLIGREITWQSKLSLAAKNRPRCCCIKCGREITSVLSDRHFNVCFK